MKLQNLLDLSTFEITRFRIWNQTSHPADKGIGTKYFNTNSGHEAYNREVIFTNTGWRSAAYLDDIEDITSNTEFIALKEKVELLSGDVDTDAIINNMKDVEAFLEGFTESQTLMDLLNSKLDKSGGTITGNLYIGSADNASYVYQMYRRSGHGFRINNAGSNAYLAFGELDSSGADLTAEKVLEIGDNGLRYSPDGSVYYPIIHSGNIGDYALKRVNNITSLDSVNAGEFFFSAYQATNVPSTNYAGGLTLQILKTSSGSEDSRVQLAFGTNYVGYVRGYANGTYTDWKTIAFTDSDITGNAATAYALITSGDVSYAQVSGNNVVFGYDTGKAGYDTFLGGKTIRFRIFPDESTHTDAMRINSSGNVTFGSSDLAGTSAKLYVDGLIRSKNGIALNRASDGTMAYYIRENASSQMLEIVTAGGSVPIAFFTNNQDGIGERMRVNGNGNVLIGTTEDDNSGAKLQVNGNVSISNNNYIAFSNTAKTPLYQLWMTGNDVFFVGRGSVENGHESVYCGKTIRFATGDSAWNNSASIDENGNIVATGDITVNGLLSANGGAYIPTGQTIQFGLNGPTMEYADGAIKVTGNFYATGTVASGNVGEEGGGGGGGGGSASVRDYTLEIGNSSYPIAHNFGTTNVIVQVFEENTASGSTAWDLILTDISITDANNIIVSFGRATTARHLVHIIGGE